VACASQDAMSDKCAVRLSIATRSSEYVLVLLKQSAQLRRRPSASPSTTSTRLSLSREMPTTISSSVSPELFSNE